VNDTVKRPPALLLAAHGSQDEEAARELEQLTQLVAELAPPGVAVASGCIELAAPSLPQALAGLIAGGATEVAVVPLMLFAAGHTKNDIPALLARCRLEQPGVRLRYGRHLGLHPDLLAIVDQRLAEAVPEAERPETTVLLCGRGSSDPDANADVAKLARLLWEGRPWPLVEVCYTGITTPTVPDGLERCRRLGATRLVALPYLLFTGRLEERVRQQCGAFAAAHPEVAVRVAARLGPDLRIARLVLARYQEILEGDPRMNCDLCVHRVALPGFEHKVGAPATPHAHPGDPPDGHQHHERGHVHAALDAGRRAR
jgi:sirohydrochlorin cobaltochelatase